MNERTAYAVAYLQDVELGPDIIDYLGRIDATLSPYGGQFVVHGSALTPLEGDWGDQSGVIIISFPDRQAALDWYHSDAYQDILPLRTSNSRSMAAVVDGVAESYTARAGLQILLAQQAAGPNRP